jgi:hypothetical protein
MHDMLQAQVRKPSMSDDEINQFMKDLLEKS